MDQRRGHGTPDSEGWKAGYWLRVLCNVLAGRPERPPAEPRAEPRDSKPDIEWPDETPLPEGSAPGWYWDVSNPDLERRWTGTHWAEYRRIREGWRAPSRQSLGRYAARVGV